MKLDKLLQLYNQSELTIQKAHGLEKEASLEHNDFCQIAYTHQMIGLTRQSEKEFSLQLHPRHELGKLESEECEHPWLCLSRRDSLSTLRSKADSLLSSANQEYEELKRRHHHSTNEKATVVNMQLVSIVWQGGVEGKPNCTRNFFLKFQSLVAEQGWEVDKGDSYFFVYRTNDNFKYLVDISTRTTLTFKFTSSYVKRYIDFLASYEALAPCIQPNYSIQVQLLKWLHEALSTIEKQSSGTLLRIPHLENSLAHLLMDKKADDLFKVYPSFKAVLNYYLKSLSKEDMPLLGYLNSNHLDFNLLLPNEQTSNSWDVLSDVLASIHEHDLYHDKKAKTLLGENDLNSLVLHSLKQRGLRTQKELPVGKNRVDVVFENGKSNIRCECKIAYKDSKLDKKGIEKAITLQAPSYVANNPGGIETGIVFYLYGDNKKEAMDELSQYIGELGYLFSPNGGRNQMRYELSSGKKVIEPNPINVICVFFESKSNTALSRETKE